MPSISRLAALSAVFLSALNCWGADHLASSWIIKFRDNGSVKKAVGPAQVITGLRDQLDRNLEAVSTKLPGISNVQKLWVANAVAVTATAERIREIARNPNVECAVPNRYRRWLSDSQAAETPAALGSAEWGVAKIRANEVWNTFKLDGSGVVVGQIDSGVDIRHPLLVGKVIGFKDCTKQASTVSSDQNGHGTHTAGTICGNGGIGVAPGAKLLVAKVFGSSGGCDDATILEAMQYMMDPDGDPKTNDYPRLVNNSWGDTAADETNPDAVILYQAVENWVALGILPCFSAGNSGPNGKVGRPACFPNAWAIGSTTSSDKLSFFSSVGPSKWTGTTYIKPDVSAPGSRIVSCQANNTGVTAKDGTSMSCPHVAGLVALMLQANPKLTSQEIIAAVESTVVDLGDTGKDNRYGMGRVDAFAAVSKIVPQTPAANLVDGYKQAVAIEKVLGIAAVSPLSAPMTRYLVEKARTLDDGEFASLCATFARDEEVKPLFGQMSAGRRFDALQK